MFTEINLPSYCRRVLKPPKCREPGHDRGIYLHMLLTTFVQVLFGSLQDTKAVLLASEDN